MDRDSDGSAGCSDSVVPTSRLLHRTAMHGIASFVSGFPSKGTHMDPQFAGNFETSRDVCRAEYILYYL